MTTYPPPAKARRRLPAAKDSHPLLAVLFFIIPITGVLAGVVSVSGISPHAYTSALLGLAALGALLTPGFRAEPVSRLVLVTTIVWLVILSIHLFLRGIPISPEVAVTVSGLAILVGVSITRVNRTVLHSFVAGWVVAYFAATVAAVAERFFGYLPRNNNLVLLGGRSLDVVGLSSFFGNPNGFALFLCASSLVFLAAMSRARKKSLRLLHLGLQVSVAILMVQTNSRTGLTLLLIAYAIWAWIMLSRTPGLRIIVMIFTLAMACAIFFLGSGSSTLDEFGNLTVFSTTNDGSLLQRFNLFMNGMFMLTLSPLIGLGPDMYEVYMQRGAAPYDTGVIINPHNGIAEIASQYGAIILLLLLTLMIRTVRRAAKRAKSVKTTKGTSSPVDLSLIALIAMLPIASTMQSSFLGDPTAWLYLTAVVVLDRLGDSRFESVSAISPDLSRPARIT